MKDPEEEVVGSREGDELVIGHRRILAPDEEPMLCNGRGHDESRERLQGPSHLNSGPLVEPPSVDPASRSLSPRLNIILHVSKGWFVECGLLHGGVQPEI